MPDINVILSKYFCGETSPEEDQLVRQFKDEHPEEYEVLQSFWATHHQGKLVDINTTEAWKKIERKAAGSKRIVLRPYLTKIASVAAIFLFLIGGYIVYHSNFSSPAVEMLSLATTNTDSKKSIRLEDGSIIYVNKNSSLSYPKSFNGKSREVVLQGEAFFEIAKDPERPFIIRTQHSDVEVLGTSFNINTQATQTSVSVATGKVKVSSLADGEYSYLKPKQSALINAEKMEIFTTEDKNYMAWKTGIFNFDKTPIEEVIKDLNSYYDQQITLSVSNSDCLFSSTFDQQNINEVIEIIQLSCGFTLNQNGNDYELFN